jgi:hypothetical protein
LAPIWIFRDSPGLHPPVQLAGVCTTLLKVFDPEYTVNGRPW